MRFIPVGIQYNKKATVSYKELKKEMEPLLLEKSAERLSQIFEEYFKENEYHISITPFLNPVDEAIDIREEFVHSLKTEAENNGVKTLNR